MKSWGRRVKQILNSLTQDLAGRLSYYYLYYPNHFLFPLLWLLSRPQEGISTFLSSTRINTLGSKHRLFSNKSFLKLMCICTLETDSPEIVAKFNKITSNVALIKNVLHPHGNFTAIYVVVKVFSTSYYYTTPSYPQKLF